MSADNGIYIAKFGNGEFRVAHSFESGILDLFEAIEDVDFTYPDEGFDRVDFIVAVVDSIWGNSLIFTDEDEAESYAEDLEKEIGWTEYGICFVYFDFDFGDHP